MKDVALSVVIRVEGEGALCTYTPRGVGVGTCGGQWDRQSILGDASLRTAMREVVENGEVPLVLDPTRSEAADLPLCFIDYLMVEDREQLRIVAKPEAWGDACQLVGFYATLCGVARGESGDLLAAHFLNWSSLSRCPNTSLILQ